MPPTPKTIDTIHSNFRITIHTPTGCMVCSVGGGARPAGVLCFSGRMRRGMQVSSIVYQTDRRSGSTYAYRSEPTRDPKTGRPSQRRTYLGRVDPETGEIVPKAAPGRRNCVLSSEIEPL